MQAPKSLISISVVHIRSESQSELSEQNEPRPVAKQVEKPEEPKEIMYSRCNVHYRDGEISWVNYQWGPIIPFNTQISVEKKKRNKVKIVVLDTGMEITFVNDQGKSGTATLSLFERLFSTEDQTDQLNALSEEDRQNVLGANVEKGMSRDAVEMSWCAPPPHRTPTLQSNKWVYWTNMVRNRVISFGSDDTVNKIR